MSFVLVINPESADEERIAFSVSEGDIDDAFNFGRAQTRDDFTKQQVDAAYHKIMELKVNRRVLEERWILLHNGKRVGGNC